MSMISNGSALIRQFRRLRPVTLLVALLIALPQVGRCAESRSGWIGRSIPSAGREINFRVFVPENPPPGAPVVLYLPGSRQAELHPSAGGAVEWLALARRERFLLIVPGGVDSGAGTTWGGRRASRTGHAVGGLDSVSAAGLIASVVREWRADPSRIYLAGHSDGAVKAAALLLASQPRFAAAALFSLAMPSAMAAGSSGYRPCPLMLMYGTADPLVPLDRTVIHRSGETLMPYRESAGLWVVANRSEPAAPAVSLLPDQDPRDGCRIRRAEYRALKGGAPVLVYTVEGGGHAIPTRSHGANASTAERRFEGRRCRDAEGVELAWVFMKGFRLTGRP